MPPAVATRVKGTSAALPAEIGHIADSLRLMAGAGSCFDARRRTILALAVSGRSREHGSCQAITYRFWAEHLGISLGTLTVRVEGDLDIRGFFGFNDSVRPGFSAVRVQVGITGPETPERYQELAAAVDEHCPVLDLFRNPVPVDRTLAVG